MSKIDSELDKEKQLVPESNSYIEGPALKDKRRNKLRKNKVESEKEWKEHFGKITEVRWDLFEDFFVLILEKHMKQDSQEIKDINWQFFIKKLMQKLAIKATKNELSLEMPEIPFEEKPLLFKGKMVAMLDWLDYVQIIGIRDTIKKAAARFITEDKSDIQLWRRIHSSKTIRNYACGSIYKGDFRKGYREGEGFLKLSTGDTYLGGFKSGFYHGVGKATYYDYNHYTAIIYEGDFENGKRHGYGKLVASGGSEYHGHWEEGL